MSLGVVLGPGFDALREGDALDAASGVLAVDEHGAAVGDRAGALRELFAQGVDTVLVLARAVPVRPDWAITGALFALVSDHLNLTGENPLVGPNDDEWGPRFPDLTDAWDPKLRSRLRESLVAEGVELREGVLAGVAGGSRTGAELSMLRMMGADMAGEGFVHEAIVTRHAGRRIAGLAVLAAPTELPGEAERVESVVRSVVAVLAGA